MMRRMFGAPLGSTTRGGQYGLESVAASLITPPKGIGGGGICFPSMVTVASGEPGVPLICCVQAEGATAITAATRIPFRRMCLFGFIGFLGVTCVLAFRAPGRRPFQAACLVNTA